jgi:hypothetical protein
MTNYTSRSAHMGRLLDLVDRLLDYPQEWVITLCDGSGISEEPHTAADLVQEATFEYDTIAGMSEKEFQEFKIREDFPDCDWVILDAENPFEEEE